MTFTNQVILLLILFLHIPSSGKTQFNKEDLINLSETLTAATNESIKVNTEIEIANYYIYHNLDSAEYYINLVFENPKTNEILPEDFYKHLLIRAWIYQGRGKLVDAKKYMERAELNASKSDNREAAIETKLNLASILADLQEENSIEFIDDFLLFLDTASQQTNEQQSWILATQLKSRVLRNQKKYMAALKEMVQLSKVSFLNNFPDHKFGILNAISLSLKKIGDIELSEKYLREAMTQPRLFEFEKKFLLFYFVDLFISTNRIDSSQFYLDKTALLQPFSNWEAYKYQFSQAKIDYHLGNYSAAQKSLAKAKRYSKDMQNEEIKLKVLLVETKILVKTGKWNKAEKLLDLCKQIVQEKPILNALDHETTISYLTLMIKLGMHDKTLSENFEKLYLLNQEKNQLVSNKKFKEIIIEYETENLRQDKIILQQDKEIAAVKHKRLLIGLVVFLILFPLVLWFAIKENKRKRNELRLNEKLTQQNKFVENANKLLSQKNQEILHRAKNHLTMLSVFMKQKARKIDNPQARTALLETENRLQAISMIDRKLNSNQAMEIEINKYLYELMTYIKQTFPENGKNINLISNIEPILMNPEEAVWIGLIVNELMTNSFKYAFTNTMHPEIKISLSTGVERELKMIYRDNGSGQKEKQSSKSFGQQLIYNFTKQMNGHIHKENDEGLVYNFQFNRPTIAG